MRLRGEGPEVHAPSPTATPTGDGGGRCSLAAANESPRRAPRHPPAPHICLGQIYISRNSFRNLSCGESKRNSIEICREHRKESDIRSKVTVPRTAYARTPYAHVPSTPAAPTRSRPGAHGHAHTHRLANRALVVTKHKRSLDQVGQRVHLKLVKHELEQ